MIRPSGIHMYAQNRETAQVMQYTRVPDRQVVAANAPRNVGTAVGVNVDVNSASVL